jgi:NADH-quinone oxidoreductase subunit N
MTITQFQGALPEMLLLTMMCVVLIVDVYSRDAEHSAAYWLTQLSLLAALAANTFPSFRDTVALFHGMFVRDVMAVVLKNFIFAFVIVGLVYARDYLRARKLLSGEYFVLALVAVLGMSVLVSAGSLLTVYLGLELLSLSLYAMVAMHRNSASASESAMKYFVMGALASGLLLYGMSILYGVTGTLDLIDIANVAAAGSDRGLLVFALVFIIAGVMFKLGVVPFHMWVPDVYEGAPTAVTLFIATAPKIAAFAMAMRLLVDALQPLSPDWQQMLIALAIASMAVGNIVAIAQTNIKRMLAYSTITHMGFLLMGMLAAGPAGYAAAMFYSIVYALMTLGAFGIVMWLSGEGSVEADRLDDFKGLTRRSPWFALMMLILMLSMAGVPPFVGFWAKWFVLKEVVQAGYVWIAAVAVAFSIIGVYYYLRVVRLMYFDEPTQHEGIPATGDMQLALSANGLAVLFLGVMPGVLMAVCIAAVG